MPIFSRLQWQAQGCNGKAWGAAMVRLGAAVARSGAAKAGTGVVVSLNSKRSQYKQMVPLVCNEGAHLSISRFVLWYQFAKTHSKSKKNKKSKVWDKIPEVLPYPYAEILDCLEVPQSSISNQLFFNNMGMCIPSRSLSPFFKDDTLNGKMELKGLRG